MNKVCNICNKPKNMSMFRKYKSRDKIYTRNKCNECISKSDSERWKVYGKNDKTIKRAKKYRKDNRDTLCKQKLDKYYTKYRNIKIFDKDCIICGTKLINPMYNSKYCDYCKKKAKKDINDKWYKNNKDKVAINNAKNHKKYMKENPLYVLSRRCRSTLYDTLKNKTRRTNEYIGCSYETLKTHIENKFKDGMSWDNMGKWHLDHKIPLCSAKNETELILLFNYKNIQPLWAYENLSKASIDRKMSNKKFRLNN